MLQHASSIACVFIMFDYSSLFEDVFHEPHQFASCSMTSHHFTTCHPFFLSSAEDMFITLRHFHRVLSFIIVIILYMQSFHHLYHVPSKCIMFARISAALAFHNVHHLPQFLSRFTVVPSSHYLHHFASFSITFNNVPVYGILLVILHGASSCFSSLHLFYPKVRHDQFIWFHGYVLTFVSCPSVVIALRKVHWQHTEI